MNEMEVKILWQDNSKIGEKHKKDMLTKSIISTISSIVVFYGLFFTQSFTPFFPNWFIIFICFLILLWFAIGFFIDFSISDKLTIYTDGVRKPAPSLKEYLNSKEFIYFEEIREVKILDYLEGLVRIRKKIKPIDVYLDYETAIKNYDINSLNYSGEITLFNGEKYYFRYANVPECVFQINKYLKLYREGRV